MTYVNKGLIWNKKMFLIIMLGSIIMTGMTGCTHEEEHPTVKFVQYGDQVLIEYRIYQNGSVSDNGTGWVNVSTDSPPQILVLVGHKVGDVVNITLQPEENTSNMFTGEIYYSFDRYETVNRSVLERLGVNVSINTTFKEKSWNSTIVNISGNNITIRRDPHINDTLIVNGLPQHVINVTDDKVYVKVDVKEGHRYLLPHPKTGELKWAWIHDLDEEKNRFIIDFNPRVENITYEIKILEVS